MAHGAWCRTSLNRDVHPDLSNTGRFGWLPQRPKIFAQTHCYRMHLWTLATCWFSRLFTNCGPCGSWLNSCKPSGWQWMWKSWFHSISKQVMSGSWVCHKIMRWTYGSPGTFPLVSIISKSPVGAKMLQTCCLPSDWFQFQHLSTDSVFLHTYVLQRRTNSHVTALVFLLDSAHGSDTSRSFKDLSLILVLVLKIGHSLRLSPQKLSGRTSTSSLTLPCRSFTLAGKTANVNFTLPGKWTWLVELMNDTLFPPVSAILMWPWYDKIWLWVKPLVAWWSLVGVNKIGQLETSADPGVRILCHGVDLGAWLARLSETSQGGKLNQNNEHPNGSKWLIVIYTYLHKLFTPISGKAGDCWCKQWFHHIRIFVASKTLPRSPPSTQMAESWLWKRPWFFSMTLWVQLGWNKWMVKQMDDKCHQLGDVGV